MSQELNNLMDDIKKMEREKRGPLPTQTKITFESWLHHRKHIIPAIHTKEVLRADFDARGLQSEATMEEFDRALALYGIRFN